jgi:hypothetical protein
MCSVNEKWLFSCGAVIVQKRSRTGASRLSDWEKLVFSVWCVDFMLRSSGRLEKAPVSTPGFMSEAWSGAARLNLAVTMSTFVLPIRALELEFRSRSDAICDELRGAQR